MTRRRDSADLVSLDLVTCFSPWHDLNCRATKPPSCADARNLTSAPQPGQLAASVQAGLDARAPDRAQRQQGQYDLQRQAEPLFGGLLQRHFADPVADR